MINVFGDEMHICGGVIISPNNVITAAHCSLNFEIFLVAGAHDVFNDTTGIQRRSVSKRIIHELFPGGNVISPHDISIFVPDRPFVLNDWVNIANLPLSSAHPIGTVQLFGWGSTSETWIQSMPQFLQTVNLTIITVEECREIRLMTDPSLTPLHDESNFCTGPIDSGIDSCGGDSGGPLVQHTSQPATVVGLVSYGWFPCGAGPSVAVMVPSYLSWIADNRVKD